MELASSHNTLPEVQETHSVVKLIVSRGEKGGIWPCRVLTGEFIASWWLPPESALSDGVATCGKGTLANLRFAGVYSQLRPASSHLLQRGSSPEHLVL